MAAKIDTTSWKPQQKQLWNALPEKVKTEVAQKGPEQAKAWVDQELGRQIDLRGTVGAGKMTGRGDKLRGPSGQSEAPKGDPGLLQGLQNMLRNPMATAMPTAQSGAGVGGGGLVESRQANNLDGFIGQGPAQAGTPIRENADGSYDLSALAQLDQMDSDPTTMGDNARCSANSTVAALMVRGKDSLKQGVANTRAEIKSRISSADDPAAAREAYGHELAVLQQVERNINAGTLTTNDMNSFADVLYQVHDTNKNDSLMTYQDISNMQVSVGLLSAETAQNLRDARMEPSATMSDPAQVGTARFTYDAHGREVPDPANESFNREEFQAAQARVASDTFAMIADGDQAIIGVHESEGPGTGKPNHIILAGRTQDGEMYVYNPIGDPNYFTGQAALDHLTDRVGLNYGAGRHRNPANRAAGTEYPLQAAVTVMDIKGQSE